MKLIWEWNSFNYLVYDSKIHASIIFIDPRSLSIFSSLTDIQTPEDEIN